MILLPMSGARAVRDARIVMALIFWGLLGIVPATNAAESGFRTAYLKTRSQCRRQDRIDLGLLQCSGTTI